MNAQQLLVKHARRNLGATEDSRNQALWIRKLWPATSYPQGFSERAPYCAAGVAWALLEALLEDSAAFGVLDNKAAIDRFRCRSAGAFAWIEWAEREGHHLLPYNAPIKEGDIIVYGYSHIEVASKDEPTGNRPFMAVGYNTNASGSRDGEGCYEKPRNRDSIKSTNNRGRIIRLKLPEVSTVTDKKNQNLGLVDVGMYIRSKLGHDLKTETLILRAVKRGVIKGAFYSVDVGHTVAPSSSIDEYLEAMGYNV